MISYVSGELVAVLEDSVIVDYQGMGLEILAPTSLIEKMPEIGVQVKIYTYFYVREDAMQLFGFESMADKELFKKLITVNGVGPKGAVNILGTMGSDNLRFAILADDAKAIAKTPGIGAKTAQKVILDLKDKIDMQESIETALDQGMQGVANQANQSTQGIQAEAAEALTALGYGASEALKAVRSVEITAEMTVEELLKQSLKHIM